MLSKALEKLDSEVCVVLSRLGFTYPEYVSYETFSLVNKRIADFYRNATIGLLSWRRESTKLDAHSDFIEETLGRKVIKLQMSVNEEEANVVQFLISKKIDNFVAIILKKNKHSRVLSVDKSALMKGKVIHYDKNMNIKRISKESVLKNGFTIIDAPSSKEFKPLVVLKRSRIPVLDALVAKQIMHTRQRKLIKTV